jgi:hypothetical protein
MLMKTIRAAIIAFVAAAWLPACAEGVGDNEEVSLHQLQALSDGTVKVESFTVPGPEHGQGWIDLAADYAPEGAAQSFGEPLSIGVDEDEQRSCSGVCGVSWCSCTGALWCCVASCGKCMEHAAQAK